MNLDDPKPALPIAALICATFFWGSSFYTISNALEHTNPLSLVAARFGTSALLLTLILGIKTILHIPKSTWTAGAVCGSVIFLTYGFNTAGLVSIPSSMSGFLTALYVPLTPFVFWLTYKKLPDPFAFAGIGLAFTGLILLANPFDLSFKNNWAEWVTMASALFSAVEIVLVGLFAPKCRAKELAFTQIACTAAFATAALVIVEAVDSTILKPTDFNLVLLGEILWLATIVAVVQVLLSWAQKYVPASRAAVIFAMESVFAAAIGYAAGESLGFLGLTGGALIFFGTLTTEFKTIFKSARQ